MTMTLLGRGAPSQIDNVNVTVDNQKVVLLLESIDKRLDELKIEVHVPQSKAPDVHIQPPQIFLPAPLQPELTNQINVPTKAIAWGLFLLAGLKLAEIVIGFF